MSAIIVDFNPRSHERSDRFYCYALCYDVISIHAPTRGATSQSVKSRGCTDFNPRSHERSDKKTAGTACRIYYFNPRSHERSDSVILVCPAAYTISIHAPTRGATIRFGLLPKSIWISIHAPTRGATTAQTTTAPQTVFQSTLPREERPNGSRCDY